MICSIVSVCASLTLTFTDFFSNTSGGVFGFLSALLTMILIFLNPQGKHTSHQNSGNDYLALRNKIRYFADIEFSKLTIEAKMERLKCFIEKRDLLNKESLPISKEAYKQAQKQIEIKRNHEYKVDKGSSNK